MSLNTSKQPEHLRFRDLSVVRQEQALIQNLSGGVQAGGLLLITGANGSGKTTLLKCLAGLCAYDSGHIVLDQSECRADAPILQSSRVWCADTPALWPNLNAIDNLHALVPASLDQAELKALLGEADLHRLNDQPVHTCSRGQRQRISLLRVVLSRRPIWLLDEPLSHLDDQGVSWWTKQLSHHLQQAGMVIMAAHQCPEAVSRLAQNEIKL